MSDGTRIVETICKLEDGTLVKYDACSSRGPDAYSIGWGSVFEKIGRGVIYSADGVKQRGTDILYFFRKRGTNGKERERRES